MRHFLFLLLLLPLLSLYAQNTGLTSSSPMDTNTIYKFKMKSITGEEVPLKQYADKVVLIVNVASECGYTNQYEGLQALYEKYEPKGLVILGFPSNDFGGQEPGTDEEIQHFCTSTFHVSFPMFSKIDVTGEGVHPFYSFLTQKDQNAVLDAEVKWNFNKFLIGRDGRVVQWFPSKVKPEDEDLISAIEKLL